MSFLAEVRMRYRCTGIVLAAVLAACGVVEARMNSVVVRNPREGATAAYKFRVIDSLAKSDAAAGAKVTIVASEADRNSAGVEKLIDGSGARRADQPRENFFFRDGTDGGRILLDLGRRIDVDAVNTYSWHPGERGPQVYRLFGHGGSGEEQDAPSPTSDDLEREGWRLLATVDTRGEGQGDEGGQYGVSNFDSDGPMGRFRYLLFDVKRTSEGPFGNTFYSEIDVIGAEPPEPTDGVAVVEAADGKYEITIDTTGSPDLTEWARNELAPVVVAWYPKIVEMLPSDGYEAPRRFTITISDEIEGVAAASGTSIRCNGNWYRRNLEGEARGATVHELVHVVQQYGRARRPNRPPGWLVEGIADYIRWFLYEPESRGAEITARNIDRARHDASYRVSANFLNWVATKHGEEIPKKLNAALREGTYREELWRELTGQGVEELGAAWRIDLERALTDGDAPPRGRASGGD